ncbi:MAG: hypothetical protein PHO15_04095 [Eubacteriales bacterium]|nr:hypothetical protein [Eubacteriales bacterium]
MPTTIDDEDIPTTGPDNGWLWWLLLIPGLLLLWLLLAAMLSVVPIAETVMNNGDGTYTIQWGYENRKLRKKYTVDERKSVLSALAGKIISASMRPPVEFEKGRVMNVFTTVADKNAQVQWKINSRKAKVDLSKQDK